MKTRNIIISILLVVCLMFTLSFTVSANNEIQSYENQAFTSYENLCHDYFSYPNLYKVYDKNNIDISTSFYLSTYDWYVNDDINSIYEYAVMNVSYMDKTELINSSERGVLQTVRKSQVFYGTVYNTKINDFEITYTLSGRLTYNANTGLVTSYSSPSLTLTHVGISGLVSAAMTDISTNATLVSDGYKVRFSCQFNILSTLTYPAGSVNLVAAEEKTGPYTGSFVAYGT